jgi:hypothetical protein
MKERGFSALLEARANFGDQLLREVTARLGPGEALRGAGRLVDARLDRLKQRIAALEAEKAAEVARIDAAIAAAKGEVEGLAGEKRKIGEMAGALAGGEGKGDGGKGDGGKGGGKTRSRGASAKRGA